MSCHSFTLFCMSARISFGLLAVLGLCLSAPNLHSHCGMEEMKGRSDECRTLNSISILCSLWMCVCVCVVWPCYPFICPLPGLALFANFAYVRIIQHAPSLTSNSRPPCPTTTMSAAEQSLNPTLVLLEIRDLCVSWLGCPTLCLSVCLTARFVGLLLFCLLK